MEVPPSLRKYEEQKSFPNNPVNKPEVRESRSSPKKDQAINALERFVDSRKTIDVLLKKGIKNFFPVQYETYDYIYDKRDLIARDRTGSGKTLAFSLPIIERFRDKDLFGDRTTKFLIVLPTRYNYYRI
jgi:superfamily II DNA/RNA helicase